MTAPDWSALLAAEEARAMAGKPAFRVRMACVAGIACPRCRAPMGARCSLPPVAGIRGTPKPAPSCRERVWAMRALQRSPSMSRPPRVADVAGFLDVIPGDIKAGDALWWVASLSAWEMSDHGAKSVSDTAIDSAIRHGLVRLSVASDGRPLWVITAAGAEYAAGWRGSR